MSQFRRIMLVTVGKAQRSPALERAIRLANASGAALHVCVLDEAGSAPDREALLQERRLWFKEEAQLLDAPNPQFTTEAISDSDPLAETLAHVVEFEADLLIKDADPETPARRLLLARLDWHLLRDCPIPLLLAHMGAHARPKRIVAAIDLDDDESLNRHIVEQALALAIQSNADLHLATVFDPLAAAEALPPLVPNLRPDQYASLSKGSRTAFDSFAADYGVPHPRRHFLLGTFKRSMRELTQHSQADVLVLGTAGHKGLEHLMLGGSARALLDHVRCDVYAVKPPALAEKLTQRIRDQASGPG